MTLNTQMKAVGSPLKHLLNWTLYKQSYQEWSADNAGRLAAALAYHAATAMAPLIIGVLAIVGLIYDSRQAQSQLMAQVNRYVGGQGAQVINTIITNASQPQLAKWAGIFSLLLLLWSASNIFAQIQDALNTSWGVQLRPDLPLMRKIEHRLLPLLIVLVIGILLIAITIAGAMLSAIASYFTDLLPGGAFIWQIINFLISLAMITLLFALIFKYLPDIKISWQDVWPGSLLTALLFVIGQLILSWYLGRQSSASLYGAAGSLIILLLWLYYSAQIFLFGAEFTQVYATRYGHGVLPDKDATSRIVSAVDKPAAKAADEGATEPVTVKEGTAQSGGRTSSANLAAGRTSTYRMSTATRSETNLSGRNSAGGGLLVADANTLSTGSLVAGLLHDGAALVEQEIALAKAEIRATVTRLARGAALVTGGGFALYAAAIVILFAVALLLSGIMNLWLALLLVGVLVMIEGWILTVSGRKRLAQARLLPEQTIESVRQDGDTLRSALQR